MRNYFQMKTGFARQLKILVNNFFQKAFYKIFLWCYDKISGVNFLFL